MLLETSRLKIRNLTETDLEAFFAYRSEPDIAKYQGFNPFTRTEALDFIREQKDKSFGMPGKWVQYGIEKRADGHLVGDCAARLQKNDPYQAEIGMTISGPNQRNGYGREALMGLMSFLFHERKVHRIVETVDVNNQASISMLNSCFFRQEGHFIENIFFKGNWGSEYQFALLRKEWDLIQAGVVRP
jgi:[ribosomal protein S5]-alanine N-acetyltransferase